ncbi:nucleolar complex protein 3 [Dioscorea alata]|uniref:Nucleolar complex protein 3 n=1 Tax=Dioscorea alata TaxID=55571 RepID=A0ACB7U299_DIOAL|nr:nucleolar complex protein 3 [Dioscorea alata]
MGRKNKNQVILPPELPPDIPEDEFEVSDEDVAFVQENPAYTGFLTNLDTKAIDKHVVRVADHEEDELEALYEQRNLKKALRKANEEVAGLQVDRVDALPIKTLDGELRYRTAKESVPESIPHEKESGKDDDNKGVTKLTKAERRQLLKKTKKEAKKQVKEEPKVSDAKGPLHSEVLATVEKELSAEELFTKKKIRLAEVGMSLLENPEANIKSLKEMLQICDDEDPNVVKLGLLSLLAVFKDIIPGYRIRLPTEKEMQMPVSKDVKKTRFYESTLLRSYKTYLLKLTDLVKRPSFQHVVIQCLCSLLEAVPHFNFRESLLASVVMNMSSMDDVVRKVCCDAIRALFVNEGKHGGEATIEAVRLIANLVKVHDCQLHPDTIEVFLSLVFDEDLGKFEHAEDKKPMPRKKKGRDKNKDSNQVVVNEHKKAKQELMAKTRQEVIADFKAVSFVLDAKERLRMQTETLSAVFETYFRVLKRSIETSSSRAENNASLSSGGSCEEHPLLAPCLNGLGKFSHLIDLDFMGDLMGCLKKLSGYKDHYDGFSLQNSLSVSERLQCCIVAFRVMRSNLDALNVDLHDFFVQLYNLLLEYRPDRDNGEILAEALKTLLWEGKQHDMQRAAAFIKRLATFSLSYGSAEAMAALITLKHLLQKNSKCRNLLENDAGGGSLSGLIVKYQADAKDPNLSGALASVLWELSLLAKHYHPSISSMAASVASMASLDATQSQIFLSTASPLQGFTDLSIERELFNFKPAGTPASLKRKRKRGRDSVLMNCNKVENMDTMVDEVEVKRKLEDHYTVLRDIAENEVLRGELNHTIASIQLYEEYKKHEKQVGTKINKKNKVRKRL